jgi:DNA polymerase III subunit alpha|nr:MAG TPA: DNA polymerase III, alpha subunit [Caudoviricetes sp.]
MKAIKIKHIKSTKPVSVVDCFVDGGYRKDAHGSLPDVDQDFQSDKRQEVKEYYERRYNHNGKQRVFSAGTFTTLKVKAVIKDVARTMRIAPSLVNYLTAIFEDDKMDYTGIFKLASENRKVAKFIHDYPMLFENIRTLMSQPRSSSIHASALLVTPDSMDGEDMECFDYVPIKKVDGVLVSEDDGYSLDELGLLKNDCLATKELSKLHETIDLVNANYGTSVNMEEIVRGNMDDPKVYELLKQGFTQNVFQFSSTGMTKFLVSMKPNNIHDLIAANALFRPATLDSGSTDTYVNCKTGYIAPTYLWGTYNAMKDTFGVLCYQEQLAQISREVGGLSLAEGVKLVKFISKKKQDKIDAMKDKFMSGAQANGCPIEDAKKIWEMFEVAGGYCFNKSHSTAYAATAYVGAWLKANYPTAFYTIALQWADDKELLPIMSEMSACSVAKVVSPDINKSGMSFYTDYQTNSIFWSLSKIKMLGVKAVDWIINERNKNGEFTGVINFIERVFKYKLKKYEYWDDPDNEDEATRCPVNARHVLNLILAGCFDNVEHAGSVIERYAILEKAAETLGFEIKPEDFPEEMIGKHYFWAQKQIKVSGLGAIDYKRIYDNSDIKQSIRGRATYRNLADIVKPELDGTKAIVCATIIEIDEKKFTSKKTGEQEVFCKLTLQQNNDTTNLIIWSSEWKNARAQIINNKNKIIICMAGVRYSEFSGKNELQLTRNNLIDVL